MSKENSESAIHAEESLMSSDALVGLNYGKRFEKRPINAWLPLLLASLAIAIRLSYSLPTLWSFENDNDPMSDQREYVQLAHSLWSGNGLVMSDEENRPFYAFRMPGYPIFLALCRLDWRVVLTLQAAMDASAVLAMYVFCWKRNGTLAAILAGLAVALHPFLIYLSSKILSETLFTVLLVWGVLGITSSRRWARVAGMSLLILSVYVRPSAIGLPIAAAFVIYWEGESIRKCLARATIAVVLTGSVVFLSLSPWAIRNRAQIGSFVFLTTNGGHTAYDSFNPKADGSSNQADFRKALADFTLDPWNGTRGRYNWSREFPNTEVGQSQFLSFCARRYAMQHPARVIQLAFAKLVRFWSPVPLSADFGGRWLYVAVGGLYAVPLFFFAAVGLWRGKLSRRSKLILLLPAIYFSLVHSIFVGSLRYRVPCDVPLAVLAAAGVVSLFERKAASEAA